MKRALVSTTDGLVYEAEIGEYTDYYEHLKCEMFDVVSISVIDKNMVKHDLSIFVDDEGLFKPNNVGRLVGNYPQPLFGNLVIMGGVDEEGETLDCTLDLIDVVNMVSEPLYTTKG